MWVYNVLDLFTTLFWTREATWRCRSKDPLSSRLPLWLRGDLRSSVRTFSPWMQVPPDLCPAGATNSRKLRLKGSDTPRSAPDRQHLNIKLYSRQLSCSRGTPRTEASLCPHKNSINTDLTETTRPFPACLAVSSALRLQDPGHRGGGVDRGSVWSQRSPA